MPCADLHFTGLVVGRLLLDRVPDLRNEWVGDPGKVSGHTTTLSFYMKPIVRFLATEAENLTRCSELLTVSNKNLAKRNIETREAHLDRRENCAMQSCAKRNAVQSWGEKHILLVCTKMWRRCCANAANVVNVVQIECNKSTQLVRISLSVRLCKKI